MLLAHLTLAALCQGIPQGSIPNLTYPPAELYQQISPNLSPGVHENQPHVVDGYLFLSGNGHQEIWDIADPYAPTRRATLNSPHAAGEAEGHQLSFARVPDGSGGWDIFAATVSGRGIDFWKITDPNAPELAHALELPGIDYGDNTQAVWGIAWDGRYVWVGGTSTGLHLVDALDPYQPTIVSRLTTAQLGGISAGPVFALGNLLVVTTPKGSSGIATIDIGDPHAPVLLDVERPNTGGSYIGWFYGRNTHLQTPFRTFDVTTDPTNITLIGTDQTPNSEYMNFSEGRLFLGSLRTIVGGLGGVLIYDNTDPNDLQLIAHVPGRNDPRTDDQFCVPVGNLLVLSDDEASGVRGSFIAPIDTAPDTVPPSVMYVDPPDGAIGQPLTTRVGFSFSDQIELATLDPTSVIVRPVLGGANVPGRFGVLHTVASFSPDVALAPNTAYEVILPAGGVKDVAGNGVATTFRATFRTGSGVSTGGLAIAAPPPSLVAAPASFAVVNPDPQHLTYTWDFGDGTPSQQGPAVTHTFTEAGRFGVRVTSSTFVAATIQAEYAGAVGGAVVRTGLAGHHGPGYVEFPRGAPNPGVRLSFTATAPTAAPYTIRVRYSNGATTTRRMRLRVNGVSTLLFLAGTGGVSSWAEATAQVHLREGHNDLDLLADVGTVGAMIDEFVLEGLSASSAQAEALPASGGVTPATARPGFRGTGYAAFPASGAATQALEGVYESPTGGVHLVRVRYAADTERRLGLYVDGVRRAELTLPALAAGWATVTAAAPLAAGTNTIALRADAGTPGPDVDEVQIDAPPPQTTASVTHIAHRPISLVPPARSGPLAFSAPARRVFTVNPDADTVTAVDVATRQVVFEVPVGRHPVALALHHPAFGAPEVWVTGRDSNDVTVLDGATGATLAVVPMPYGSRPHGVVMAPNGAAAYVALEALGRVLRLDPTTRQIVGAVDLTSPAGGPPPRLRGLAVSSDSTTLLAPRFVSSGAVGEVFRVNALTMQPLGVTALAQDLGPDTPDTGRGLPNHLASITISPDGAYAFAPGVKSNIQRGEFRDGLALSHDSTVRPLLARIDLASGQEDLAARIDLNDADSPVAVETSHLGDLAFVALQGLNEVDVRDVRTGEVISSLSAGRAPRGLVLDDLGVLWVHNFMGRSLTAIDVAALLNGVDTTGVSLAEVSTVAAERLPDQVLRGKRIFYDASDPRMAFEGYLSCASCHVDGADDGQVWDFTDRGEGFRNTTSLEGRGGSAHGPVHWTANFDEIQDFENDIRAGFGGIGFMSNAEFLAGTRSDPLGDPKAGISPDLDALAAYVASLRRAPPSPYRQADGTLTADAALGRALFDSLDCRTCHAGPAYTDSGAAPLHDVGTIAPHSGRRRGQPLTGFDTPTLKGAWATAPYFHDGSAATLDDVLMRPGHGSASSLTSVERGRLVAYLAQLDETLDLATLTQVACAPSDAQVLGGAALAPHSSLFDAYGVEFLAGDTTAAVRWTIGVEGAATRTLRVFGGPRGTERLELWVNGAMVSLPWAPGMPPSRGTLTVTGVALRAGVNVIEVRQSALGLALHVDGVLIQ